jgi:YD repeat-containing protein
MQRSAMILAALFATLAAGPAAAQTTPILVDRSFDARGNVASETLPFYSGETSYAKTFRYDTLNRLILTTDPDATTRSVIYNIDRRTAAPTGSGQIPVTRVTEVDELSRQRIAVADASGRPIELTRYLDATPAVESRRYDRLGNLLGLTDPGGSVWSYTYDFRGLRLSAADPDLGAWSYVYDAAGRLSTQTDARSLTTVLGYDALNRVLTKTAPRPDAQVEVTTNTYDEVRAGFFNVGSLTSAAKTLAGLAVASQTFDRDGEGNLAREQWTVDGSTYTATTGFAPMGEVLWRTYPDGDSVGSAGTPFTYDAAGRLFAVPGVVSSTTYAADGQTASISYPNGVSTAFTYRATRRWLDRLLTPPTRTARSKSSTTRTTPPRASPRSLRAARPRAGPTRSTRSTG